ncbi:MAG: hypothetical protein DBX90_09300 [Lentisphaerae bacterium]|nr:MAG: hypothetical protein DBX90_09300 [Lentisphaerota bacterium]
MNALDYIVIAAYLLLSLLLGCRVGSKLKNTEDYFLSGRQMKWWPVAIALFAALFSSISYIAMPGEAYNYGCTMLVSGLTGVIALPVMLFVFLKFFYNMKLWTVNEYLENRFSPAVRVICGSLFLAARCFYLGVVLYATAMLLANSFGISPWAGILVVGIVSTAYTYFGGMEAVIWTDVMQFIVLMGGILLVIGVVAWETPGGVGGIWSIAVEHGRTFNLGSGSGFWEFNSTRRLTIWPLLIGLPFALFLPAIDQVNLQRCMTCRNFREVARAVCWSTLGNWPICFLFYFAGLAVFAYYQVLHPELGIGLNGDDAFCHFISNRLPMGARGLLVAGVLAAVMSTISAVENSLATVWIKDVYQRMLYPGREDSHYLKAAKLTTLLLGLFACLFGITVLTVFGGRNIPLLEVSNVVLGMLGTFTSMVFTLGLLTYRTNAQGMIAGIIAGVPVTVYTYVFRYLLAPPQERMSFLWISILPMAVILAVGYLWSLATNCPRTGSARYVIWSRWNRRAEKERL